mgnify:CR=1 FL=1
MLRSCNQSLINIVQRINIFSSSLRRKNGARSIICFVLQSLSLMFTNAFSRTEVVTVHLIFVIYKKFFSHLEAADRQHQRKRVFWKKVMLDSTHNSTHRAARVLHSYRSREIRNFYGIATMLAPSKKLHSSQPRIGKAMITPSSTGNAWKRV